MPSGGVALGNSMGVSPASFQVTGTPYGYFYISLPGPTYLYGPGQMTIDNFTSSPSMGSTFDGMGAAWLTLGADLHVGAYQPSGQYSGSFTVWVYYY
jgi:hypothetical protein